MTGRAFSWGLVAGLLAGNAALFLLGSGPALRERAALERRARDAGARAAERAAVREETAALVRTLERIAERLGVEGGGEAAPPLAGARHVFVEAERGLELRRRSLHLEAASSEESGPWVVLDATVEIEGSFASLLAYLDRLWTAEPPLVATGLSLETRSAEPGSGTPLLLRGEWRVLWPVNGREGRP